MPFTPESCNTFVDSDRASWNDLIKVDVALHQPGRFKSVSFARVDDFTPEELALITVLLAGFCTAPGLLNNLARLLPNGQADASFAATAVPISTVRSLLVQSNGAIVVGGAFTAISGQPASGLAHIIAPNVLHMAAAQAVTDRTEAWPVPAHARLTVAPDASAHPQSVELVDLLGRPVLQQALSGATPAV